MPQAAGGSGAGHEEQDYLAMLRGASAALSSAPNSHERGTFFPNWPTDENEHDDVEVTRAIRRAARAVLARKTETGEGGRRVSKQDVGHLLEYLASMLE